MTVILRQTHLFLIPRLMRDWKIPSALQAQYQNPSLSRKVSITRRTIRSSSATSYEKKPSNDTNLLTYNENLSSNEGETGVKVVDDIVAAALAYAEMTHGSRGGAHCPIRLH